MIRSLFIKNFALLDEVNIRFGEKLNIITGESGAGKSIIVGALAQICGARGSIDLIRNGQKKAVIEVEFDIKKSNKISSLMKQLDIDFDNSSLLIRKEIHQSGHSRIFVNDSPIALTALNQISSQLIDLHGQHQHQLLLHPENHLAYLDAFAGLGGSVQDFQEQIAQYGTMCREEERLLELKVNALKAEDIFRFQIDEIAEATAGESDLEALHQELSRLNNFEKLHQAAQAVLQAFYAGDNNAVGMISGVRSDFDMLVGLEKEFASFADGLTGARETLEEIGQACERYLSEMEFDPQRAEFLRGQIARLEFLLKKYQKIDMTDLMAYQEQISQELSGIGHLDTDIENIRSKKKRQERMLLEVGLELSRQRHQAAIQMGQTLNLFFDEIAMKGSRFLFDQKFFPVDDSPFSIDGQPIRLLAAGFDQVTFLFSANPGEPPKPLHKVVSGGEISRIMLALKSVLAAKDHIPILVFDEVDSGISGKAAQIVGKKIADLTGFHQLICITHLPQIAAYGDRHYKVQKKSTKDRTAVTVELLDEQARKTEIAGLLGGVSISTEAIQNAGRLLEEARKGL